MKKILIVVIGIFSGIALGLGVFGMTLLFSPDESRVSAPEEDIRLEDIAPPPTLDENEPLFTLPPQPQPETAPETEPPAPTVQALPEKKPEKKPEKTRTTTRVRKNPTWTKVKEVLGDLFNDVNENR